jgi:Uncharacterized conserved protein
MKPGKLVRDKIPTIIRSEGRIPMTRQLSGPELLSALQDKLAEELAEYQAASGDVSRCEELADLIEVIFALARLHGYTEETLMAIAARKKEARGGFEQGFFYLGDEEAVSSEGQHQDL